MNSGSREWIIFGASGFVGSHLKRELEARGEIVNAISSPRLSFQGQLSAEALLQTLSHNEEVIRQISQQMSQETTIVINAAGLATPDARASYELFGANSLLPIVLANASLIQGAKRFIHISSAAVQGSTDVLDETENVSPFSPYSLSKAMGELALKAFRDSHQDRALEIQIVRATSVQGSGRKTTESLVRLAKSPFASVAAPGTQSSVVSSIAGLVEFIIDLGQTDDRQRGQFIALQPWEGATVTNVLEAASGGKKPILIPRFLARSIVSIGYFVSNISGRKLHGLVRRIEVLWFGQEQYSNINPSEISKELKKVFRELV